MAFFNSVSLGAWLFVWAPFSVRAQWKKKLNVWFPICVVWMHWVLKNRGRWFAEGLYSRQTNARSSHVVWPGHLGFASISHPGIPMESHSSNSCCRSLHLSWSFPMVLLEHSSLILLVLSVSSKGTGKLWKGLVGTTWCFLTPLMLKWWIAPAAHALFSLWCVIMLLALFWGVAVFRIMF